MDVINCMNCYLSDDIIFKICFEFIGIKLWFYIEYYHLIDSYYVKNKSKIMKDWINDTSKYIINIYTINRYKDYLNLYYVFCKDYNFSFRREKKGYAPMQYSDTYTCYEIIVKRYLFCKKFKLIMAEHYENFIELAHKNIQISFVNRYIGPNIKINIIKYKQYPNIIIFIDISTLYIFEIIKSSKNIKLINTRGIPIDYIFFFNKPKLDKYIIRNIEHIYFDREFQKNKKYQSYKNKFISFLYDCVDILE